jgi:uncharacterized protein (TIGR02145 family)
LNLSNIEEFKNPNLFFYNNTDMKLRIHFFVVLTLSLSAIYAQNSPCNGLTSINYNGYNYDLVEIGSQCWFKENLRTAAYNNGDPILNITDNTEWSNTTTPARCFYNNLTSYQNSHGNLYNWYVIADPRNVCPIGWHVPSDAEWTTLVNNLGGPNVAGGKMKTIGTWQSGSGLWSYPNTEATNSSGFSGLPGGFRQIEYNYIASVGSWWTSSVSEMDVIGSTTYNVLYDSGIIERSYSFRAVGMSIRCISSGSVENDEIDMNLTISAYPNPSNTFVTINSQNDTESSTYAIFNSMGQQVLAGKLEGKTNNIDISDLEAGIYLIQIGETGGLSFKMIKN